MKRILIAFGLVVLLFSLGTPQTAEAQQWSAAQNEVWNAILGMCACIQKGDVEGLYKSVHKDFIYWNTTNDIPGDYAAAKALDTASMTANRKWLAFTCTPITIQVFDSFAVINFYSRGLRDGGPGQNAEFVARRRHWVMKKEGSAWLSVANYQDSIQRPTQ